MPPDSTAPRQYFGFYIDHINCGDGPFKTQEEALKAAQAHLSQFQSHQDAHVAIGKAILPHSPEVDVETMIDQWIDEVSSEFGPHANDWAERISDKKDLHQQLTNGLNTLLTTLLKSHGLIPADHFWRMDEDYSLFDLRTGQQISETS